jgi:2-polyprenyl-6-methoxyphenol hydroxylase-like FAD-dependent oxidoreductase
MSSNAEGLSVIVVGGGIAGLAAARGLREQHRVTVIESSKFKNEIGAAVHLAPNITPILLGWGIDLELLKPVPAKRILLERDHQNNTLADVVLDSVKLYGSPWWWVHRGDLHAALRKLATDPNGPGKPAEILLGKTVTACDPSTGTVTLSDGTTMTADVIVGGYFSGVTDSRRRRHQVNNADCGPWIRLSLCALWFLLLPLSLSGRKGQGNSVGIYDRQKPANLRALHRTGQTNCHLSMS